MLVNVNPILSEEPCVDQNPDPIEREISDLYPACAFTRAMSRKALQKDNDTNAEVNLADTCVGQALEDNCRTEQRSRNFNPESC